MIKWTTAKNSFISGFSKHCEADIVLGLCDFAALCEFLAATALVAALVPQLHKNSYLKSVQGLSVLWASALFTATLLNCFYFFETKRNIYLKIIAITYCVTAFGILLQFWMYSKQNLNFKMMFCGCCFVLWGALIAIQLAVPVPRTAYKLEWISIILFSIDLVPQVILNIMCRSTLCQSNISVVLGTFGKTLSYISVQILITDIEWRVMNYIAVFVAHVNCFQLLWYRKPPLNKKRHKSYGTDSQEVSTADETEEYELKNQKEIHASIGIVDGEPLIRDGLQTCIPGKEVYYPSYIWRLKKMTVWQICACLYLFMVMVSLPVISCIVSRAPWLIIVPFVVPLSLFLTFLYRDHQEGRFSFCVDTCTHICQRVVGRK